MPTLGDKDPLDPGRSYQQLMCVTPGCPFRPTLFLPDDPEECSKEIERIMVKHRRDSAFPHPDP